MSGSAPQYDRLQRSDSDLSLLLSDASSLSSAESDLPELSKKKSNKKKKALKKKKKSTKKKATKQPSPQQQQKYCVCRRGYNGKEFMIECERCEEWFHGACIGLPATAATVGRYICKACEEKKKKKHTSDKTPPLQQRPQRAGKTLLPLPPSLQQSSQTKKKPVIVLSIPKPPSSSPSTTANTAIDARISPDTTSTTPTTVTAATVTTTNTQQSSQLNTLKQGQQSSTLLSNGGSVDDEEEDLDDICVLCEGDCVCGAEQPTPSAIPSAPLPVTASAATNSTKVGKTEAVEAITSSSSFVSTQQALQQQQQQQQRQGDAPSSSAKKQSQTKIIISLHKPSSSSKKKTKKAVTAKIIEADKQHSVIERDGFVVESITPTSEKKKKSSSSSKKKTAAASTKVKGGKKKKKNQKKEEQNVSTPPMKTQQQRHHQGKSPAVVTNILHNAVLPPLLKLELKSPNNSPQSASEIKNAAADLYKEDEEELVVDDLDDLLETMSTLSETIPNDLVDDGDTSLSENEEFFTDDSLAEDKQLLLSDMEEQTITSLSGADDIDSGDDEDLENEETRNIINEIEEEEEYSDSEADNAVYVEDDYEDEEDEEEYYQQYYARDNSRWSSTDDDDEDDDDEDEEFDCNTATVPQIEHDGLRSSTFITPDDDSGNNSAYNDLTAAFLQALAATAGTSTVTETADPSAVNTPTIGSSEQQISIFGLVNTLAALSTTQASIQPDDSSSLRRLSLPSSAVSAVRRMRGSQDYTTSESLRALSAITADDLSLMLEPIDESTNEILMSNSGEDTSHTLNKNMNPKIPDSSMNSNNNSGHIPQHTQHAQQSIVNYKDVQDQLLDILNNNSRTTSTNNSPLLSPTTPTIITSSAHTATDTTTTAMSAYPLLSSPQHNTVPLQPIYSPLSTRQLLPKPTGSGSIVNDNTLLSAPTSSTSTITPTPFLHSLNQQLQQVQQQNAVSNENSLSKRKAASDMNSSTAEDTTEIKRSRTSRSNSFNINTASSPAAATRFTSFSTPASPTAAHSTTSSTKLNDENENEEAAVSMDEFLDTSKLYAASSSTRLPSPLPPTEDDPYSRDLSRWQRIPIGAFRLMRFKNKLWLDR